jgi:hypothetical protein
MALKEGAWYCDVCGASLPEGQDRVVLPDKRLCCPQCWAKVRDAELARMAKPPLPGALKLALALYILGSIVGLADFVMFSLGSGHIHSLMQRMREGFLFYALLMGVSCVMDLIGMVAAYSGSAWGAKMRLLTTTILVINSSIAACAAIINYRDRQIPTYNVQVVYVLLMIATLVLMFMPSARRYYTASERYRAHGRRQ